MGVEIRPITQADWRGLWPIIETVTRAGETYTYPLDMTEAQARAMWTPPPPGGTLVAVENGQVLGAAKIIANQPGNGAHVANGSFMVAPEARGRRGPGAGRGRAGFRAGFRLPIHAVQRRGRDQYRRRGAVEEAGLRDRGHGP